jgi:hypothetical protein
VSIGCRWKQEDLIETQCVRVRPVTSRRPGRAWTHSRALRVVSIC